MWKFKGSPYILPGKYQKIPLKPKVEMKENEKVDIKLKVEKDLQILKYIDFF